MLAKHRPVLRLLLSTLLIASPICMAAEVLNQSVRPEPVEGQMGLTQGLRQAQPERRGINQRFPRGKTRSSLESSDASENAVHLKAATPKPPPDPNAPLLAQIEAALAQGAFVEARRDIQKLLRATPGHPEYEALWLDQHALETPDATLARLRQLQNEAPRSALIQSAIANQWARQGQWAAAQAAYLAAHQLNPAHPDPLYHLGLCLEYLKQPEQAVLYYREALAALPALPPNGRANAESRIRLRLEAFPPLPATLSP